MRQFSSQNRKKRGKRLLVLEPYFGGSHRRFTEGLIQHGKWTVDLLTLPAHGWKWRMRFAAPYFAQLVGDDVGYDGVFCSSMFDVATFRGIGPEWLRRVRLVTYFHENQFVYPNRHQDERDIHFAVTNLTTAIASDRVVFNSTFNQSSFFAGVKKLLRHLPDMKEGVNLKGIWQKSSVLYPGMDFSGIDSQTAVQDSSGERAPLIIWNHRWEHDKNPARLFEILYILKEKNVPFRLALLGQPFRNIPTVFGEVEHCLGEKIVHRGYAPREMYYRLLRQGDVVVSTALHEFFGMAVIEAVRAGCRPLLPNRLSYPELYGEEYLYGEEELEQRLTTSLRLGRLSRSEAERLTEKFSWLRLAPQYGKLFETQD
jgi:glycosyltransferase involved in cell wall biosynthesis